jgi:LacI family transcriptional regulator
MRQVTIHDVAAVAGVSAQTVSRVINHRPDVAQKTREHVLQTIQQLGYTPNTLARSLISRRSRQFGAITLAPDDWFRGEVLAGLEMEARLSGFSCQLAFSTGESAEVAHLIEEMLARQVEGIALIIGKALDHSLLPFHVPIVTLAQPFDDPRAVNIHLDNVDGGYQATRHLLQLDHRAIGFITRTTQWLSAQNRMEGARRALAEHHQTLDPSWVVECEEFTLESGHSAARQLLARHPQLTALICHNDMMALGACRALREMGRSIPCDVSVIGYDDLPICEYVDPPLSSVRQPKQTLGQLMAQLLVAATQHDRQIHQDVMLPVELVVHKSVAPPKSSAS